MLPASGACCQSVGRRLAHLEFSETCSQITHESGNLRSFAAPRRKKPRHRMLAHDVHYKPPNGPRPAQSILLVEDHDAVRIMLRMALVRQGYTVLEARSGADAMALLRESQQAVDLLITDVVLPHMSGPRLAAELVSRCPEARVLYISGHSDELLRGFGLSSTDENFLAKPLSTAAVLDAIQRLLENA
jgi:CheY-like chemotaxis protein